MVYKTHYNNEYYILYCYSHETKLYSNDGKKKVFEEHFIKNINSK